MRSVHHLNATDLDEITRHRRLLTSRQRWLLDAINHRIETYPQRFARGPRYAQNAGLVLLSDWERRRKFCHCSIRNRLCGLWKLCDHCSYRRRTLLLERFLTQFSCSHWWFLTISFEGELLSLEGHVAEDKAAGALEAKAAGTPLVGVAEQSELYARAALTDFQRWGELKVQTGEPVSQAGYDT